MNLREETIKELLEKAKRNLESAKGSTVTSAVADCMEDIPELIASVETCLDLYERVRELEKIVARHKELGIGENV